MRGGERLLEGLPNNSLSKNERDKALRKADYKCGECGKKGSIWFLQCAHKENGRDPPLGITAEDVEVKCVKCHLKQHRKLLRETEEKLKDIQLLRKIFKKEPINWKQLLKEEQRSKEEMHRHKHAINMLSQKKHRRT